jgi:YD repeat-containing protein
MSNKIITTWHYEGSLLVAINHPHQAERYIHDAQGRITSKTIILKLPKAKDISITTHYRYDARGRLSGISLPDGSTLDYQRNAQSQITALERNSLGNSWLGGLIPRQVIVQNIESDAIGFRRVTYGNGIEGYYQRSKEGNLARIVYRNPQLPTLPTQNNGALETLGGSHAFSKSTLTRALGGKFLVLPGALGLPPDPKSLLDHRYLWDTKGNLLYTRDKSTESSYIYDAHDRLIATATAATSTTSQVVAENSNVHFTRYHYDGNGNRLLAQEGFSDQSDLNSNTVKTSYAPGEDRWQSEVGREGRLEAYHNAAGQPEHIGTRNFVRDALGRLLEVREGQYLIARYRYNHRGERIEKFTNGKHIYYLYEDRKLVAELYSDGTIRRQYIYLADQPVAFIDSTDNDSNDASRDKSQFKTQIAIISRALFGKADVTTYLQSNHLGPLKWPRMTKVNLVGEQSTARSEKLYLQHH